MTEPLDIPALRAVHEAATPGEWTANDLGQGQQIWAATYVGETRDYNANDALAITTYHNTYAALLDRAERCDELEGVLAAVEQGASNTIHLISAKLGELEAENARLRAYRDRGLTDGEKLAVALKPFARAAKWWIAFHDFQRITSLQQHGDCLEVVHLRLADKALTEWAALSTGGGDATHE